MIAENIASLFGATSVDPMHPRDPALVKMFGLGERSVSGVQVDERKVLGMPAVWRGCNILGNGVAKVRPLIYRRTEEGRERDTEHDNWRVVTKRANPLQSAGQFRKTLTIHSILWGNGLGHINRLDSQKIESMVPLMPDRTGMMVVRNGEQIRADDELKPSDEIRYFTREGNRLKFLMPENVIHIPGLSINGYWGLPVVEAMADSFGIGMAAREFGGRFFGRGANSSAVIYMPPGLDPDQQDDYAKALKTGYSGLGTSHQLMILENESKVEKLTIAPEAAQFLGTREFENREYALALGIQPHKLGDPSRKSFNSLEQSNQEHLDDDLDPHLQVWEDELEEKCLTERQKDEGTHHVEFNRKGLVRTNLQAQTDREMFERTYGIHTANDIRRRNNENPIGPVGDTYLVPQNHHVLDGDGLPVMAGMPDDPNADQGNRDQYEQLAMNRVERFIDHALAVAKKKATSGKGFLEFLDNLPSWDKQPAAVSHLLESATSLIAAELTVFVEPPHKALQLEANVAAAAPGIREDAIRITKLQLEKER